MPGKFLNEITADKPAKDDLGLFFDKSKNTAAQSSLVDIVAAGLDITSGKAGEAPVVIETVNPDGTKTQTLGWGKTGSSAGSQPPRPANSTDLIITHDPASGTDGAATPAQVLTAGLPAGGNAGDALTFSAGGVVWSAPLPASTTADKGKQLTVQADGKVAWSSDSSDLPAYTVADKGKQLTVKADGLAVEWVTDAAELPAFTITDAGKHLNVKADGKSVEWVAPELPTLTAGLDALQIKADKSGVEWTSSVNMSTNLKGGYTGGAFFPVNDTKTNTTRFVDAPTFRHLAGVPEGYAFDQWTPTNRQTGEFWPEFQLALTRLNAEALATFGAGNGEIQSPGPSGVYSGNLAFTGGVLLPNGKVFLVPYNSTTARIYDPVTGALTTPSGTYPGSAAFFGGVLLPNGKVFLVPCSSTTARIYDPATDTLTTPTGTYPGNMAFYGGVLLSNGKVFLVPYNSTTARVYDPVADSVSTPTGTFSGACYGGVLLPSGKVFCVPNKTTTARVYDPATDTVTASAPVFQTFEVYAGGVLLPSGKVFLVPYSQSFASIYDPISDTLTSAGGSYPGGGAFSGGVLLPSGRVFCVPQNSTTARIYDPYSNTTTTLGGTYPGSAGYRGAVLLPNGNVFCVPANATAAIIAVTGYGKNLPVNLLTSPFFNKF